MQASRCNSGTTSKIQQAQIRGAVEQAAQGLIAHKVAGGAGKAELLKAGEAWARSHCSPRRFGQPHQVQQPQHLGARPRLQMGRGMTGGRGGASGTCSWGQPLCRASTGNWRGVLFRLMPVLTSRRWSWGQQLPCRGGGEQRVRGLAVPGSLAQHLLCSCLLPTYQQCTQDGCCLGAVGQPQLAHSGPHLLQEAHHSRGLHLRTQYKGTCHLGLGFFRAPGVTGLTTECCISRLWSWGQALASMIRVLGVTPWQSESLRKVSRGQDSLASCRTQRSSRVGGGQAMVNKRKKPVAAWPVWLSGRCG